MTFYHSIILYTVIFQVYNIPNKVQYQFNHCYIYSRFFVICKIIITFAIDEIH